MGSHQTFAIMWSIILNIAKKLTMRHFTPNGYFFNGKNWLCPECSASDAGPGAFAALQYYAPGMNTSATFDYRLPATITKLTDEQKRAVRWGRREPCAGATPRRALTRLKKAHASVGVMRHRGVLPMRHGSIYRLTRKK